MPKTAPAPAPIALRNLTDQNLSIAQLIVDGDPGHPPAPLILAPHETVEITRDQFDQISAWITANGCQAGWMVHRLARIEA